MNNIQVKNTKSINLVLLFAFLASLSVLTGLMYVLDNDVYSRNVHTKVQFISLDSSIGKSEGDPQSYETTSDNAY